MLESGQIFKIRLTTDFFYLTAICLDTEEWRALFACLTRKLKGADLVSTVARFKT